MFVMIWFLIEKGKEILVNTLADSNALLRKIEIKEVINR